MALKEILWGSGGAIIILLTLIQITPIKVNPWTAVGRVLNADLFKELDYVEIINS